MVSSHSGTPLVLGQATGNTDSLDSPRPKLGGSHHLPPYSILCVTLPHLHPNVIFSQDSQSGVPKLSRFALPRLWASITSCSNLWLGWSLKKSCSSPWELSNAMLHSTYWRWIQVDSQLLVVGSLVWLSALLLPITWVIDVQMAHTRPIWTSTLQNISNGIRNTPMWGVLTPTIKLWVFKSPRGLQIPTFGSVSFILTLSPKWGCDRAHVESNGLLPRTCLPHWLGNLCDGSNHMENKLCIYKVSSNICTYWLGCIVPANSHIVHSTLSG